MVSVPRPFACLDRLGRLYRFDRLGCVDPSTSLVAVRASGSLHTDSAVDTRSAASAASGVCAEGDAEGPVGRGQGAADR